MKYNKEYKQIETFIKSKINKNIKKDDIWEKAQLFSRLIFENTDKQEDIKECMEHAKKYLDNQIQIDKLERESTTLGILDQYSISEKVNESDINLYTYKDYLINKGMDKTDVNKFIASIKTTSRFLGDPKDKFQKRGLVFGQVQSGKTGHYIGLAHQAINIGYKLIIILTSNIKELRFQTQERVEKDLIGSRINSGFVREKIGIGLKKYKLRFTMEPLTNIDSDANIKSATTGDNVGIMVVKKDIHRLREIYEKLKKGNYTPTLILDDEADWGSVDTSKLEEDYKAINNIIKNIYNVSDKISYVAYTATPFANLLSRSEDQYGEIELFPKDFITYMEPGQGYHGFHHYYFNDEKNVKTYDDSFQYKDDVNFFESYEFYEKLEKFVILYILQIFRSWWKNDGKFQKLSGLINISYKKENHKIIERKLNNIINSKLKSKDIAITENWSKEYIGNFDDMRITEFNDEWNKFSEFWSQTISITFPKTVIINSDNKDTYKGRNRIIIGGHKLSRGGTFDDLAVCWYHKNTNQYDTILQMCRWFGYNKENTILMTSNEIYEKFFDASESVKALQDDIKLFAQDKIEYSKFKVRIKGENPTSSNKKRYSKISLQNQSFSNKNIGELSYSDNQNKKIESVNRLIRKLNINDSIKSEYGVLWENIDGNILKNIIESTSLAAKDGIYKYISEQKVNIVFRSNSKDKNGTSKLINDLTLNLSTRRSTSEDHIKSLHTSSSAILDFKILKIDKKEREIGDKNLVIIHPFISDKKEYIGISIKFSTYIPKEYEKIFTIREESI